MRFTRHDIRQLALLAPVALGLVAGAASCSGTSGAQAQGSAETRQVEDLGMLSYLEAASTAGLNDAQLAHGQATQPAVRRFADAMVQAHTDVFRKAREVERAIGYTAENDEDSRQLTSATDATRDSLRNLRGAAFDRAFLDVVIREHQDLLGRLDHTMIPGATDPRVRAMLLATRAPLQQHLDEARQLRLTLGG